MHIKQVIISGFRSYKDQFACEPFSSAHNVVIGRNGTGKSNFFDAIRFVLLTARFANLRAEERQALLHEGSGKHVMSAFVEIVFDNSDGRFPIDTEQVVLRRTIGIKKDEFFLNRKHISKSDVTHLLESAGFSRSNPYYIVQQGKVNALALMKEKERLELLKEVAGTKVYEDRRLESYKLLQETKARREKIQEVIRYIEERLNELEGERNELKEFQELDREQKALEYTMHQKELQGVRQELDALERERMEDSKSTGELHEKLENVKGEIAELESSTVQTQRDVDMLCKERETVDEERREMIESQCRLELKVKELEELINSDREQRSSLESELKTIEENIEAKQKEMETDLLVRLYTAEEEYKALMTELQAAESKSNELIMIQSRKNQFKSQKQRDDYLNREIKETAKLAKRKKADIDTLKEIVQALTTSIDEKEQALEQKAQELQKLRLLVDGMQSRIMTLKEKRNEYAELRKEKWRTESDLESAVRNLQDKISRGYSVLHSTMPSDVRRGIQAVKSMSNRTEFQNIYGPLIELVKPMDERFCTATDEAAGGSMFHVVVDTDKTAAKIMQELEKKNLGRVTFLPLNSLKIDDTISYPKTEDCVPLMSKLEYAPKIRKAVFTAFGKKLLCMNLETCLQYAEETNMDCLTLEGDMVHRRGALQGGFRDPQCSRSKAMMQIRSAQLELEAMHARAVKAKREAQQADQRVASTIGEIQKEESEKQHAIETYERVYQEIEGLRAQIALDKRNQTTKLAVLNDQETDTELQRKLVSLQEELTRPMEKALSAEEVEALHALSLRIAELQAQERKKKSDLEELRSTKQSLQVLMDENLKRRKTEITTLLKSEGVRELELRERKNALDNTNLDVVNAARMVQFNTERLKTIDLRLTEMQDLLTTQKLSLETLHQHELTMSEELEQKDQRSERILYRRQTLVQKRDEALKSIRELGALVISQVDKYKDLQLQNVIKAYRKCKQKLKKYSHVNKKAMDQYVSFDEQRTSLLDRQRELDAGYTSIEDLIQVLDRRKDEAILRTFKGVSHHFSEVFRELVPSGEGKMLIIKADDASLADSSVDTFSGVQIKVSFRGEGDSYLMQQLSGGQKALVALGFIFAIQRCDPAPFYLLDEIDQALDSTYRASVAALIHRQAHSKEAPAQFITSTFRPELVSVADAFYGVGFQNRISNVHSMTKQESLDFIANIMAEERVAHNQG